MGRLTEKQTKDINDSLNRQCPSFINGLKKIGPKAVRRIDWVRSGPSNSSYGKIMIDLKLLSS